MLQFCRACLLGLAAAVKCTCWKCTSSFKLSGLLPAVFEATTPRTVGWQQHGAQELHLFVHLHRPRSVTLAEHKHAGLCRERRFWRRNCRAAHTWGSSTLDRDAASKIDQRHARGPALLLGGMSQACGATSAAVLRNSSPVGQGSHEMNDCMSHRHMLRRMHPCAVLGLDMLRGRVESAVGRGLPTGAGPHLVSRSTFALLPTRCQTMGMRAPVRDAFGRHLTVHTPWPAKPIDCENWGFPLVFLQVAWHSSCSGTRLVYLRGSMLALIPLYLSFHVTGFSTIFVQKTMISH